MTREKLVEILRHDISKKEFDKAGGFEEALVDRILAAIDQECGAACEILLEPRPADGTEKEGA